MTQRVVIVGAGAAGTSAATHLRQLGFAGQLTLLHAEAAAPYNRTTVNKTLLHPDARPASVRVAIPSDAQTRLLASRAELLDVDRRVVVLEDGTVQPYDAVLISTGARPRTLAATESAPQAPGTRRVTPLRTYDDAVAVRQALATVVRQHERPARVAVAGGGLLGAEAADTLSAQGHEVFLMDEAAVPLRRRLGAVIASWVESQHSNKLARRVVAGVEALQVNSGGVVVSLSDGTQQHVDLVIEALGVIPDIEWLATSALIVDDGVRVSDRLRALNADGVYAAGDLARVQGSTRTEHWGHATAQGRHAAQSIAHSLGASPDPGPFRASGSYSTWLYGRPINVMGVPSHDDLEMSVAPRGAAAEVTLFADSKNCVRAAVTLGSAKMANRLRPLVAVGAPIEAVSELVARTLPPE